MMTSKDNSTQEPAPFRRIAFAKLPRITLDGLRKVELVEGSGEEHSDLFCITYQAGGKTYESYTNVAGLTQAERTAILVFIGRYARTQAIRKKTKARGRQPAINSNQGDIDLDTLTIEMPDDPTD